MKIMKFGGTSVGNPDRMRSIIPLINGEEKVIVVLSALSGTTNSLVVIPEAVASMKGGAPDRERLAKYESYGAKIVPLGELKPGEGGRR